MKLSLIAAIAQGGVIGRDGTLPWRLPADLRRFRELTTGHTVVMGRKTWESIGRALPDRENVVISTTLEEALGATIVTSLGAALDHACECDETNVYVIGGARVYAEALPGAHILELTRVEARVEGDVYFPAYDANQFERIYSEPHPRDEKHAYSFRFETWQRIRA